MNVAASKERAGAGFREEGEISALVGMGLWATNNGFSSVKMAR